MLKTCYLHRWDLYQWRWHDLIRAYVLGIDEKLAMAENRIVNDGTKKSRVDRIAISPKKFRYWNFANP